MSTHIKTYAVKEGTRKAFARTGKVYGESMHYVEKAYLHCRSTQLLFVYWLMDHLLTVWMNTFKLVKQLQWNAWSDLYQAFAPYLGMST